MLEFIPYEWLSGDSSSSEQKLTSSPLNVETGIERFGTNTLVSGLGSMLVLAIGIFAIIILLIGLKILQNKSERVKKIYLSILKVMKYSAVIRYMLQSTLKLHIAACTVIAFDRLSRKPVIEPTKTDQIVYASLLLVILNSCPFIFFAALIKNRKNLNDSNT